MGIVHDFARVLTRPARHPGLGQNPHDFVFRFARCPGLDKSVHFSGVLNPGLGGVIAWIINQVFPLYGAQQGVPHLLLGNNEHIVVGTAGMATIRRGGDKPELIARAFNRFAIALVVAQADPNQIHHRVLHGHFNLLAGSRGVALHKGGQDTDDAVHAGARVSHTRPGDRGRIVGKTGHAHRAAHRLGDGFKTLERAIRPRRTKAFDAGIDQTRIELFEAVIAKSEPFHRAGSEVLQHDIGGRNQFLKSLLAVRLFEVKRQAALVGIEKQEEETVRPRSVIQAHAGDIAPAGRLDLDHVSPEPG